jgi:hypothetical protein
MLLVWVQSFWNGKEIVSFVGDNPTEEDLNAYWSDEDKTKKFIRAEVREADHHVERILDVENGWDLTSTLWARTLVANAIAGYHS